MNATTHQEAEAILRMIQDARALRCLPTDEQTKGATFADCIAMMHENAQRRAWGQCDDGLRACYTVALRCIPSLLKDEAKVNIDGYSAGYQPMADLAFNAMRDQIDEDRGIALGRAILAGDKDAVFEIMKTAALEAVSDVGLKMAESDWNEEGYR